MKDTPQKSYYYMITNPRLGDTEHQLTMAVQDQTSPRRGNFGLTLPDRAVSPSAA